MKRKSEFINKVVRQGNSLCIRIPNTVKKELNLEEGDDVLVSLVPQQFLYRYDEDTVRYLLKISNKISKLDKYSQTKKRFFIMLNFEFLKETASKNSKERKIKQNKFFKEKRKEFGSKLINEFVDWGMIFNKETMITEGDSLILKPEFR